MKVNPDNKLEKLFERLRQDGWYCGWGLACCQSCAWMDVPDYFDAQYDKDGYLIREDKDGNPIEYKDVDLNKCLFNHEQDCQIDLYEEGEECDSCCGDGWNNETEDDCEICNGMGYVLSEEMQKELDIENRKYCAYPHYTYDEQKESTFCYSGDKNGVKNLKAILPIIEEMGCTYHWNGKGDSRISITWE
jgi:hypothetical protein